MAQTQTAIKAPAAPPQRPSLISLAREYLAEANGDTDAAAAELGDYLTGDPVALRSVLDEALSLAASEVVTSEMRRVRNSLWQNPQPKTSVLSLANGIANSLLDFPLAGGIRLRDATKEQVAEQAHLYRTHGSDMIRKAGWLDAIAKRVPEGTTVGEALTESDVLDLHKKATSK